MVKTDRVTIIYKDKKKNKVDEIRLNDYIIYGIETHLDKFDKRRSKNARNM